MAQMKGISPIIAIVVVLLVTVTLGGAAWTYISNYFGGMVSSGIEIVSVDCTAGGVNIYIHNIGTDTLSESEVAISRAMVAGTCDDAMEITYNPTQVGPDGVIVATDINCSTASPGDSPQYTVIAGGRVQKVQTTC